MIKFTQIPDVLKYPPKYRAKLSTMHSEIVIYVTKHFNNTSRYKSSVIAILNTVSYYVISGDSLPTSWTPTKPLDGLEPMDSVMLEDYLGDLYIQSKYVVWDVSEAQPNHTHNAAHIQEHKSPVIGILSATHDNPTPKEHLYIKAPTIPQFDVSKPWLNLSKDGVVYTIYHSLPLIPTNQSQISITTDVNRMTKTDLMRLYPNHPIKTRAALMYDEHPGLVMDSDVGIIFPIDGYTDTQIKDNIIKYPHIYKLTRYIDDTLISFYSKIEIDGVLYDTMDIWDQLPESRKIPRNSEFIKEYVVRRYLLERDHKGIVHKYPIFGTLEPFLTLFTTPDDYARLGYPDSENLAIMCVKSRVSYKQSRNPILRAVYNT